MLWATRQSVLVFNLIIVFAGSASAQNAAFPWEGEVSGTNVYVRSGAGANWYPTTKLSAGERILVLGEKYGWYQITPPSGSFSYVDMAVVERAAGAKKGVIKSDKVYIRAGSQIEQRKNATQLVLNKGASVDILGESEGFYKIAPPPGATLYISKQYVKPIDTKLSTGIVERHLANKPPAAPAPIGQQTPPVKPPVADPVVQKPQAQVAATPVVETKLSSPPTAIPEATANDASLEPEPTPGTLTRGASEDSLIVPKPLPGTGPATPSQIAATPIIPAVSTADAAKETLPSADKTTSTAVATGNNSTGAKAATKSEPKTINFPAVNNVEAAPAAKIEPAQNRYQTMLATCESELVSLLAKPLDQQDPTNLLAKYEEIAAQSSEFVPAEVAKIRVRQLKERTVLRQNHLALHKDEKDIAAYRANMDNERMAIMRRRVEQALDTFDIEGELRRSLAFAQDERRYRLVNPDSGTTLAYVDIPKSVDENPDHLIGRLVGIKVAGKTFSPSARVPIAVASQVVDVSTRRSLPQSETLPLPATPAFQSQPEYVPSEVRTEPAPPPPPNIPPSGELEKMRQLTPGIHLAPGSTETEESTAPAERAVSSADQLDRE